ncbi:MAG TPA: hypothetical protein VI461_13505 [Chitinophagaceae bacterium]|nr:hypothetical protein [Chitinophagaceae bacterium]
MRTRLIVDSLNQLREQKDQPRALLLTAKIVSYIFHPVFVPVYILLFLLYVHPSVFAGSSELEKRLTLLQAILMYGFFPIISVLLLKALKFIDSIYLNTQRDRIIPYVICNIWYFWIWYVWRNLPDSPGEIVLLSMAIFLASAIGLIANIYMKISMHAIAAGVLISFMIFLAFAQPVNAAIYIAAALLTAGFVCTARFIASNHSAKEIYSGLTAGFFAMILASLFV